MEWLCAKFSEWCWEETPMISVNRLRNLLTVLVLLTLGVAVTCAQDVRSSGGESGIATAVAALEPYAWQRSDRYVAPDPEQFFPDDPEGGRGLDALLDAVDRDRRSDEEILSTVRRGFRRTTKQRERVLAWIGNRYIWHEHPQNPGAIEIMYHAVPMERHYAVYFGLSVVQPKTPNILRTLAELCMRGEELHRITWGTRSQRDELVSYIEPYLKHEDPEKREMASALLKHFRGEADFQEWKRLQELGAGGPEPTWVVAECPVGESKYALQCDGLNDFVTIPNSESLDIRGSLALSAWVKNDGDDDGQIIWRGDTQGGRDPYELHLKASRMEFRVDAGPGDIRDTSYTIQSKEPVDGRWHFWTGVYDKESSKVYLYKDGQLERSAGIHHEIEYDTSAMWNMIGAVDRGEWQHFRGSIDEVRVWNVARSAEEIRRDMNRTLAGDEPGLVACWSFDEGTGRIAHDGSRHGNDAQLGVWTSGVTYEEAFLDLYETLGREYPCFELKGIDWPQVGEELLPRARSVDTDEAFGLLCLELVARLEDSHAHLQKGAANPLWPPMPQWDPGFACLIDDRRKPVVYYFDPRGPAEGAGVKVGMTVVSINGQPADEAIEECMTHTSRYVGYSSRRYLRYQAARWFLRQMERGAMVPLLLQEPDGRTHEFELPATLGVRYLPRLPVPVEGIADAGNVSWKMLEEDIGYIYVRRIRGDLIEKLDRAVAELKDARGLIVDVRGNSGGGFDARRAHRNFDPDSEEEPERRRFGGPMALLIDARCISAGEGWASWFIAQKRARVFGEATAGASSRKRTHTLKNGLYRVTFPVKAYRGFLDRPIERRGLEPDVPLRQNARDLAAGRDTVLEAAKRYLLEIE